MQQQKDEAAVDSIPAESLGDTQREQATKEWRQEFPPLLYDILAE